MSTYRKDIRLGTKDPLWGTDDYANKSVTREKLADDVLAVLGTVNYIPADHKGSWQEGVCYTTNDVVYNLGCAWICMNEDVTEIPTWNAEGWQFIMGNNLFSLGLESSRGLYFRMGSVDTEITARILFGSFDVTDKVLELGGAGITWTRDTGNAPEDRSWHPSYIDSSPLGIKISDYDVGYNFRETRKAIFTLKVEIPTSTGYEVIMQSINIK